MKEDTTHGLDPEKLARLLALGLQGNSAQDVLDSARTPQEALRYMIGSKMLLDPTTPHSLPAVLKRPCEEMLAVADRTMGDLLLDPKTDLAVVKTLKDYGKELARRGGPEEIRATATAIYYAAIASALVFHRKKITGHSYDKLQEAYGDLEQKKWIPSDLKDLFEKAKAACQERKA